MTNKRSLPFEFGNLGDKATFSLTSNKTGIRLLNSPICPYDEETTGTALLSTARAFLPKVRLQPLVPVMKSAIREISVKFRQLK